MSGIPLNQRATCDDCGVPLRKPRYKDGKVLCYRHWLKKAKIIGVYGTEKLVERACKKASNTVYTIIGRGGSDNQFTKAGVDFNPILIGMRFRIIPLGFESEDKESKIEMSGFFSTSGPAVKKGRKKI